MVTESNGIDKTYTLDEFISMKSTDDITYHNFSIVEVIDGMEFLDHSILDDYMHELLSNCVDIELTPEQYVEFKYCPDLLAYKVYGSIQLDFIVLFCNDMIDPKEFNRKKIKLPYASTLSEFLNQVYSSEVNYIKLNRNNQGLSMYR